MHPTLELFGVTVGTYGVCAACGFLLMLVCARRLAARRGLDPEVAKVLVIASFLGAGAGASLLYGAVNASSVAEVLAGIAAGAYASPLDAASALAVCFAGLVFYGGLLGALLTCRLLCRRMGQPFGEWADVFAVAVPLFHACGRVGCFMAGCCYGVEADWGVVFESSLVPEADGVPRVPVQLVEAACVATIFAVTLALYRRGLLHGRLVFVYGFLYALVRFVDEFWRGDAARGFWGPLSTSQWLSLGVAVVCVLYAAVSIIAKRRAFRPA